MRSFRDFEIGDRERLGPVTVCRHEAIAFAARYDPQPFHLSDEGAADHPFFAGIVVSGWLTCALMMRLLVDEMRENPVASVGTPGVDRIRWRSPVYPGDALVLETEVSGKRLLKSRPHMGLVHKRLRTTNQHRRLVMTSETWEFVALDSAQPERRHSYLYGS
ncbi:MAG: acyl dehydratase [Sandarakinorhabdus sp.]|nr:acyl dehydratase [Sandarakinorhabdus sp.]